MAEAKFAAYRQYLEQRQLMNSAVMALLAGSHLAHHTLLLTEGSSRPLREIFPSVTHIDRFNLKSESARELLIHAEEHLSAMAIPYILALQESLFGTFEGMLVSTGGLQQRPSTDFRSPVWIVKKHWTDLGLPLDTPSWQLFEFLIELRNDIIHRAGAAGPRLMQKSASVGSDASLIWSRMAGTSFPTFTLGQKHQLDHADMVVCLAVTKFLAKEGNENMQICYPRGRWVADIIDEARIRRGQQGNLAQRLRRARSHARLNYQALQLADAELEAEILRT